MRETLQFLAQHGYGLLIVAVLGRQACLPMPANLLLVAAGALARSGKLNPSMVLGVCILTFLAADLSWYQGGRRFGDRILHFICGFSRDSGSCVDRATDAFACHHVRTLLFSKFVVGLDAVAAPLAGASRMNLMQFILLDAFGALLWSTAYLSLGYVFSDQLDRVAVHLARTGGIATLAVVAGFSFYLLRKLVRWLRFVREFNLARITPEELRDQLNSGADILLVDLQGRFAHANDLWAIPGAVRINPYKLEQYKGVDIPRSREVVLYCNCAGEITSARVALALRRRGIEHVRPLAGGLQAWRDRGFPVTSAVRFP